MCYWPAIGESSGEFVSISHVRTFLLFCCCTCGCHSQICINFLESKMMSNMATVFTRNSFGGITFT